MYIYIRLNYWSGARLSTEAKRKEGDQEMMRGVVVARRDACSIGAIGMRRSEAPPLYQSSAQPGAQLEQQEEEPGELPEAAALWWQPGISCQPTFLMHYTNGQRSIVPNLVATSGLSYLRYLSVIHFILIIKNLFIFI